MAVFLNSAAQPVWIQPDCAVSFKAFPVSLLFPLHSLAISGKDGAPGGSGFSAAPNPNPGFGSGMRRSGGGADTGLVGRQGVVSRLAG